MSVALEEMSNTERHCNTMSETQEPNKHAVHFSSADTGGSDCWETPLTTFLPLDAEFHFTLDAAASTANAKVTNFFTEKQDALRQTWAPHVVWLNPPYSESESACSGKC